MDVAESYRASFIGRSNLGFTFLGIRGAGPLPLYRRYGHSMSSSPRSALTIYTSAFIAEIVRAGILSVSRGQMEASHALGIRHGPTLRLVIIRSPPRYYSAADQSVLESYEEFFAGHPDRVLGSVNVFGGISLNQTGQAIEIIFMSMSVYLCFSLLISLYMNWYNRRIALTNIER